MLNINNDQTGIICFLARDANTVSAKGRDVLAVHANVYRGSCIGDETCSAGFIICLVAHKAMCGIGLVEEVELIEEACFEVVILQHIISPTCGAEECKAREKECRREEEGGGEHG